MHSNDLLIGNREPYDLLKIVDNQQVEVIRVTHDGQLYWRERFVETDEDFKNACTEMIRKLTQYAHVSK